MKEKDIFKRLRPEVVALSDWIIAKRQIIHANPELAYQEFQTSALVQSVFKDLKLDFKTDLGITGVAAVWDSGRPGPVVAFRAEMDAIRVTEENELCFASKNKGIMHACGHDGHLAILLGLAKILAENGKKWPINGKVMFICQPAEEGGAGAKAMLDDGLFEWLKPDFIFGSHLDPEIKAGFLHTSNQLSVMAGSVSFTVIIHGEGGHGAMPELAKNPLMGAAAVITALGQLDFPKGLVITPTMVHAGRQSNIIPKKTEIKGTLRYLTPKNRETACDILKNIVKKGEIGGLSVSLDLVEGYPATINDSKAQEIFLKAAHKFFGEKNIVSSLPSFGAEDISYFFNEVPGAFFWLGAAQLSETISSPLHSPTFNPYEKVLPLGVELYLHILEVLA